LRNEGGSKTCSINVLIIKQGGGSVADINLALDDSSQSSGVTDAAGTYKFTKLPCKRNYKVTPAHPELNFNLASITIANLRKNGSAVFIAAPRGIIASRPPKKGSRPCNPAPKTPPKIKFDDPVTGKLSPQNSWCEESVNGYFHLYQLDGVLGGDIIQFDLQSDGAAAAPGQPSDLRVQVIDRTGNEIAPNGESDDPSGRQVILPTAGDYILRVIGKSDKSSDYRLSVTRKGLTDEGYRGQLDLAYAAIAEPDSPTFYGSLNQHLGRIRSFSFADGKASERKASEQKINEATAVLDRLRAYVPDKPDAYSMLAAIHLYFRKDLASARNLATRSLELGGEARFRVNFGERLDRDQRRITDADFPCWLIIKKAKVSCEGFKQNEGEVFNSKPEWISKKSLDIPLYSFGLTIYGEAKKKESRNEKREFDLFEIGSYYFLPLSALDIDANVPLTEVSTIKRFIRQFVEIRKEDTKQKKKD